jgi:site-specific DNA-methyltransferase (adenine-specific)
MTWQIHHGECVAYLDSLPPNSIDAIVTDPPYGLSPDGKARTWDDLAAGRGRGGFMGRAWDSAVPGVTWARACFRVLKPGGYIVAFASTRTIHRLTVSVEDAGFEIRDQIAWLQWQGFPKSLDVSKALDQHHGAERAVVGVRDPNECARSIYSQNTKKMQIDNVPITAPATEDAKKWQGWGTALKPSQEPAILARKPLEGTVAENVLKWGVGGLNVDGCRIGYGDPAWPGPNDEASARAKHESTRGLGAGLSGETFGKWGAVRVPGFSGLGRWPANIYQCPKASRSEREAGCEGLPPRAGFDAVERKEGSAGLDNPRAGAGRTAGEVRNCHPTVKPIAVMRWLVRLVTPEGGTVLDPFTGSGTTGIAAVLEGRDFLGAEMNDTEQEPFVSIAKARIAYWERHGEGAAQIASKDRKGASEREALEKNGQQGLF